VSVAEICKNVRKFQLFAHSLIYDTTLWVYFTNDDICLLWVNCS